MMFSIESKVVGDKVLKNVLSSSLKLQREHLSHTLLVSSLIPSLSPLPTIQVSSATQGFLFPHR